MKHALAFILDKDLFFTLEHEMLRQSMREFVEGKLVPHADEREAEGMFPDWVFRRLVELGYLGLHFPEEYGGGDYFTNIVLMEELAKYGSFGVNTRVAVQIGMATPPILVFGTEHQKRKCLVPAIWGEKIACLGISGPEAKSDVASAKTYAEKVPGNGRSTGTRSSSPTATGRTS